MRDRKIEKAKSWFNRAVTLDPDNGDAWAAFHRFLSLHGREEERASVTRRCCAAEPRHGDEWCKVRKAMENAGKSTEDVLQIVSNKFA